MLKKTYKPCCKTRITVLVFLRTKLEFWYKMQNLKSRALHNQNYCHIVLRGMNLQHYFVAFVNCTSIFHNYIWHMVKWQINLVFADLSQSLCSCLHFSSPNFRCVFFRGFDDRKLSFQTNETFFSFSIHLTYILLNKPLGQCCRPQ